MTKGLLIQPVLDQSYLDPQSSLKLGTMAIFNIRRFRSTVELCSPKKGYNIVVYIISVYSEAHFIF